MKRSMNHEASQFALELEQLERRVLASCHGLPDTVLQWPLPLADPCSLFSLAEQVTRTIDYWVLVQIGDRPCAFTQPHPLSTFAQLSETYEEWIHNAHILLDVLPGAFLDLFIGTRSSSQEHLWDDYPPCEHILTTRTCLIHALAQCAEYVGQIVLIRKFFEEGNRFCASVEQERQMYQ
jgi:hypothetical protein